MEDQEEDTRRNQIVHTSKQRSHSLDSSGQEDKSSLGDIQALKVEASLSIPFQLDSEEVV
jgi:hypothetical protein